MVSMDNEVEFSISPAGPPTGVSPNKSKRATFSGRLSLFKGFKVFGTPKPSVAPFDKATVVSTAPTLNRKGSGRVGVAPPAETTTTMRQQRTSREFDRPDAPERRGKRNSSTGIPVKRETKRPPSAAETAAEEFKQKQRTFFDEMERNMRRNFAKGMISVEVSGGGISPVTPVEKSRRTGSDIPLTKSGEARQRGISTVDDSFLDDLKRNDHQPKDPISVLASFASTAPQLQKAKSDGRQARPSLLFNNSTNTIHIDSTLGDPDIQATIRCVCRVLHAHMSSDASPPPRAPSAEKAKLKVFLDVSANAEELAGYLPSLGEMTEFFRMVFKRGEMHVECIVTALIFVERLLRNKRGLLKLGADNWRPIVFSTMILASKVCDDESPLNADWCYVCSDFTLNRINELETALLAAYNFNACVSASEYATYYFHLRSMAARLGLMNNQALRPLDITVARRIAERSNECTNPHHSNRKPLESSDSKPKPKRSFSFRNKNKPQRRPSASIEQIVSMKQQVHGSGENVAPPKMRRRGSV